MNKLHYLVSENNLKEALNYLLYNYSIGEDEKGNICNLMGQLTEIDKKESLNTASSEEIVIAKSRIRKAILTFGSEFEKTNKLNFQPDNISL